MPDIDVIAHCRRADSCARRHSMLADACENRDIIEEVTSMTHISRTHLYRQAATAIFAVAVTASALPAQAQQYQRRDGYHGRPVPQHQYRGRDYRGHDNGSANLIAGALLGLVAGAVIVNSAQQPPPAVIYTTAPPPPPPGVVYYNNNDDNNQSPPPDPNDPYQD
jgi:hypothetical protein